MKPKLMIHLKSGKTASFTLDREAANGYLVRFSDWISTGDDTDAPIIDVRDVQGAGLVVAFTSIECLEIEGR